MQRSINKKIGSCLLRFTPSPSPALLTRHHYSHFPLSRLLTLSQFLHSSPSFNHSLQQPSSYCKFVENGALFSLQGPYCGIFSKEVKNIEINDQHRAALWCNFLVFSLKFGVWLTTSSHVMLAEVVHSAADFANQKLIHIHNVALLAYGLSSSRRAPDAIHP
ncbi:hypothetical protein AAG906_001827 [Vitis piasezkii]